MPQNENVKLYSLSTCEQVLQKMKVKILAANWISLPRVLVSKKPVSSPRDIANIKMRVPEIETYLKVWKGLGTKPYPSCVGGSVSRLEDRDRGCG